MESVGEAIFMLLWCAGAVCWAVTLFFMFQTVTLRKPGVSMWKGTALNPFNLLLQPAKLSEAGRVARRRCFFSAMGFIGCVLLAMAIGLATGLDA
jgi:hypothetical protein